MKNWWWLTNYSIVMMVFLSCPKKPDSMQEKPIVNEDSAIVKGDTMSVDQLHSGIQQDTAVATPSRPDTLSKEDKYHKGTGQHHEAPKHGTPDQMKLDSIKKSKKKG